MYYTWNGGVMRQIMYYTWNGGVMRQIMYYTWNGGVMRQIMYYTWNGGVMRTRDSDPNKTHFRWARDGFRHGLTVMETLVHQTNSGTDSPIQQ